MPGSHHTPHQRGIIRRYYQHRDTIAIARLAELVSDLAMQPARAQADRLWAAADRALASLGVEPARARRIIDARDVDALARLAGELA